MLARRREGDGCHFGLAGLKVLQDVWWKGTADSWQDETELGTGKVGGVITLYVCHDSGG